MAKTEKRTQKAVLNELCRLVTEWQDNALAMPGSTYNALYVAQVKKLLAETQKCDK